MKGRVGVHIIQMTIKKMATKEDDCIKEFQVSMCVQYSGCVRVSRNRFKPTVANHQGFEIPRNALSSVPPAAMFLRSTRTAKGVTRLKNAHRTHLFKNQNSDAGAM